jgi:hypothetical protein
MGKKKVKAVPEWLNSPIWSTPPPAPAPADPFGTDFSRPLTPPPEPPPSVPPPPTYEQAVGSYAAREREAREEEGAGAALRAHLLSDFKAAVGELLFRGRPAAGGGLIRVLPGFLIVLPFVLDSCRRRR